MEIREIQAILESVLFAAGDAVDIEKLADIVDVDRRSLREILKKMMDDYNYERRGIHIIQMEDAYQMCTRGEYHDYVAMLAEPRRKQSLSNAAIEVLAIVAYKQPVTRSTIEHIRGVNCDYIVNRLIERNLIEEVGRLDAPGPAYPVRHHAGIPALFWNRRAGGASGLRDLRPVRGGGGTAGNGAGS